MKRVALLISFILILSTISINVSASEIQTAKYKLEDIFVSNINAEISWGRFVSNDRILAYKNGKLGVIDTEGNVIIDFLYDDEMGVANGCIIAMVSNGVNDYNDVVYKYGVINVESGETVIPFEYDYIEKALNKNYFRVQKGDGENKENKKVGLINAQGEVKIPVIYSSLEESYGDYSNIVAVSIRKNFPYKPYSGSTEYEDAYRTVYGYVDLDNNNITDFIYKYASPYSVKGIAVVERFEIYYLGMTTMQYYGEYGRSAVYGEDYYHDVVAYSTNGKVIADVAEANYDSSSMVNSAYDYFNGLFLMDNSLIVKDGWHLDEYNQPIKDGWYWDDDGEYLYDENGNIAEDIDGNIYDKNGNIIDDENIIDEYYAEYDNAVCDGYYLYDSGNNKYIIPSDLDKRLNDVNSVHSSDRDLRIEYYSNNKTDTCAKIKLGNNGVYVNGILYYRNGNGYHYKGVNELGLDISNEYYTSFEYIYDDMICVCDWDSDTCAIVTLDGEIIIDLGVYSDIEIAEDENGIVFVVQDAETGNWGAIDENGNTILEFEYSGIYTDNGVDGLVFIAEKESMGYEGVIDRNGNLLLDYEYSSISSSNAYNDYGIVIKDGQAILVNIPWKTNTKTNDNITKINDYNDVAVYADLDKSKYYVVSIIAPESISSNMLSQVTANGVPVNTSDTVYKNIQIYDNLYSAVDFGGTERDYVFASIISDATEADALSKILTLSTIVE